MQGKAKELHEQYCQTQLELGLQPEALSFSNRWLKNWCAEYEMSSICRCSKKRVMDFLKNIWTVRHTLQKLYGVDPDIVMSDQMPLHRNECGGEKTMNFKGASQTTFVKENHMLSRERVTVMTSMTSATKGNVPKLEFIFIYSL